MLGRSTLAALAAVLVAAVCLAADANPAPLYGSGPAAAYPPGITTIPEDFGPGTTITSYSFVALRPFDSSFGYLSGPGTTTGFGVWPISYSSAPLGTVFSANVDLPEGAVIDFARVNVCNASGADPQLIFGLSGDTGSIGNAVSVGASSGCAWYSTGPLAYATGAKIGHFRNLFVNWGSAPTNGSVLVEAAEIAWHRAVSPAPPTPTFGDVLTSHPFFQWVEALAASGITGGCGGGNYCPNNPVTRGQMAVFLSKGLGLYWANPAP